MSTPQSIKQKGLFMVSKSEYEVVSDLEVPPVPKTDLLIKVAAVSINPVDWKFPTYQLATPDAGCGCDFAGTVAAVGSDVTGFKVGDQVFSFNSGYQLAGKNLLGTAYAEYVFSDPNLTFKASLSDGTPSVGSDGLIKADTPKFFDTAAAIPLASVTAALSLSHFFKNQIEYNSDGTITSKDPNASSKYILIWGGATSVGQYAIQIATAAGYKVVTTASPKNSEYLISLGAEKVFDYHSATISEDIKAYVGSNLVHVFEPVSLPDSWKAAYQAIPDEVKEISIIATLPYDEYDVGTKKANVKMDREFVFIPSYNRFDFTQKEAEGDGQLQYVNASQFVACINASIAEGKFLSNPLQLYKKTGVENIAEAIEYFRTANVSAYKVIVKV